ncbi:MAG TPA: hypothetical protein VGG34_01265 [Opitutaceae bacterium]|jgi:predicted nucleic acid-binding protein
MGYMLDTSVFNRILQGRLALEAVPYDGGIFVTQIQSDELTKTGAKDEQRMKDLLAVLATLGPMTIPTETGVVGYVKIGEFKISSGVKFSEIKAAMERIQPKKDHTNDALIAEAALLNGHTLVSSDKALCAAFEEIGGKVYRIA